MGGQREGWGSPVTKERKESRQTLTIRFGGCCSRRLSLPLPSPSPATLVFPLELAFGQWHFMSHWPFSGSRWAADQRPWQWPLIQCKKVSWTNPISPLSFLSIWIKECSKHLFSLWWEEVTCDYMFSNEMLLTKFPVVAKILSFWVHCVLISYSIFAPYKLLLLVVKWLYLEKCGRPNGMS